MAPVFGLTHTSAVPLLRPVLGAVKEPSAWSERLKAELNRFDHPSPRMGSDKLVIIPNVKGLVVPPEVRFRAGTR